MTNSRVEMVIRLMCHQATEYVTVQGIVDAFKHFIPPEFIYDVISHMRGDGQIKLVATQDDQTGLLSTAKGRDMVETDLEIVKVGKELGIF